MIQKCTAALDKEGDQYAALCLENRVASFGDTIEKALHNLQEALELYYEENPEPIEEVPVFVTSISFNRDESQIPSS